MVLSHRRIVTIFVGLSLGMFLSAVDQMILATAIRTIADDLGGLKLQAWTMISYLIFTGVTVPIYGKLGDIYGRKKAFLFALGVFTAGSVACTLAMSMAQLAWARGLQGMGAGGLMSLGLAIIADILPPRERGRYQGYLMASFVNSAILGPLVGGALASQDTILGVTGWRWVFLINVPIALASFIILQKVLHYPQQLRPQRIDWAGGAAFVAGLAPIMLASAKGVDWGWNSLSTLFCFVAGIWILAFWVRLELRAGDDALFPLHLFRSAEFNLFCVLGLIYGSSLFAGAVVIPQYLQIVRGASPVASGLLVLPIVFSMIGASLVIGRLMSRTGRYKIFPVVGMAMVAVSMALFGLFMDRNTPMLWVAFFMCLYGAGLGSCIQTLTLAAQNAVPAKDLGVATSTATFTRHTGLMVGTAFLFSILFQTAGANIGREISRMTEAPSVASSAEDAFIIEALADPDKAVERTRVLEDSSFLERIDPALAEPFRDGFAGSMELVFLLAAAVAALGFLLSLRIRERLLRRTEPSEQPNREREKVRQG